MNTFNFQLSTSKSRHFKNLASIRGAPASAPLLYHLLSVSLSLTSQPCRPHLQIFVGSSKTETLIVHEEYCNKLLLCKIPVLKNLLKFLL